MSESRLGYRRVLSEIVGKRHGIGPLFLAEELDLTTRQVYRLTEALPGEPRAPQNATGNRGFLDITKALLDENASPTLDDIKEALGGNLCRCTGYEQIIESVQRAAELIKGSATNRG